METLSMRRPGTRAWLGMQQSGSGRETRPSQHPRGRSLNSHSPSRHLQECLLAPPQPPQEISWEAFLHTVEVSCWCPICGEQGHSPLKCPLLPEGRLLRPVPLAEGECLPLPPQPAQGEYLLVPPPSPPMVGAEQQELPLSPPPPPAEGECLLVPSPPPTAEKVDLLHPFPPVEGEYLLVPPPRLLEDCTTPTSTSRGRIPAGSASTTATSRGSVPAGSPAAARRGGAPAAFARSRAAGAASVSTTATSRGSVPAGSPAAARRGGAPAAFAARSREAPAAFAARRGGAPAAFAARRGGAPAARRGGAPAAFARSRAAGAASASTTTRGRGAGAASPFTTRQTGTGGWQSAAPLA
ncbi:UNVERIFIED_CONTAM: hypothetical protein FKN15_027184 [Acipenser sinensis]